MIEVYHKGHEGDQHKVALDPHNLALFSISSLIITDFFWLVERFEIVHSAAPESPIKPDDIVRKITTAWVLHPTTLMRHNNKQPGMSPTKPQNFRIIERFVHKRFKFPANFTVFWWKMTRNDIWTNTIRFFSVSIPTAMQAVTATQNCTKYGILLAKPSLVRS